MHISDMDPDRPGLEVFTIHENEDHTVRFQTPGAVLRDARTGEILWQHSPGIDVGAGLAADIDPRHKGYEAWGGPGGLRDRHGNEVGPKPRNTGWAIWWDGDLLRELLSGSTINKWNWETGQEEEIFRSGLRGRFRYPSLAGDLLGDWREELLIPGPEGKTLRLYTTTVLTPHRLPTLMHDPQYRLAMAWQNVVYNKPPHPGFFLGHGMAAPPSPPIDLIGEGEALGVVSDRPVTPDASPEARALLSFIHAMYGEKTLSGQMWAPWGIDEIQTVQEITGKLPAIRGQDYIHERANKRENELASAWWQAGGIPTIMWHWGAPSRGEGYEQSKMSIDMDRCFQPGTEEHTAMWNDLKRIADHLTELRDAHVPVLWRPMHECDGDWFWYGKGGGERFVRLWRTMFDYFSRERKLNNLIWVLCHSGDPQADWNPGKAYYDLAGPDTYGKGIQASLFNRVKAIHGDSNPIPYHECGTIPDPSDCFQNGITWSWWMLWHTRHLTGHDPDALIKAYHHERILTRDELPNIMDYLKDR